MARNTVILANRKSLGLVFRMAFSRPMTGFALDIWEDAAGIDLLPKPGSVAGKAGGVRRPFIPNESLKGPGMSCFFPACVLLRMAEKASFHP